MRFFGSWKIFLAACVGFLVGMAMFRSPEKAQAAPQSSYIRVTPISMGGMNAASASAGGAVIGFSCVPDASHPGDGVCYVATR